MKKTIKNKKLLIVLILVMVSGATAQAATALWSIVPTPGSNPTQIVPENSTATIQYEVQNNSNKQRRLVIKPSSGITQTLPCQLMPKGQGGSSCTLTLSITGSTLSPNGVHEGPLLCQANSDGSTNANQCYQPSETNSLNITRGAPIAMISVNPTGLWFYENSTADVTVTNNDTSPVAAENVLANIPGGGISVQSTTCPSELTPGANCTITFASSTPEGPTSISITGDNTSVVNVDLTVISKPQISITGPTQQNRVIGVASTSPSIPATQLDLEIRNDIGSPVNADDVTVTLKTACPNLTVDASACTSIAPGNTCTIALTSPDPYAPCEITVSGSNTANSPRTFVAFRYLGGLVFQESAGTGSVVTESDLTAKWTNANQAMATSSSANQGANNTNTIISYAAVCSTSANCAAYACRNQGGVPTPEWYLPSTGGLGLILAAFCPSTTSCNFGFSSSILYWSSTQRFYYQAWGVVFPAGGGRCRRHDYYQTISLCP